MEIDIYDPLGRPRRLHRRCRHRSRSSKSPLRNCSKVVRLVSSLLKGSQTRRHDKGRAIPTRTLCGENVDERGREGGRRDFD